MFDESREGSNDLASRNAYFSLLVFYGAGQGGTGLRESMSMRGVEQTSGGFVGASLLVIEQGETGCNLYTCISHSTRLL